MLLIPRYIPYALPIVKTILIHEILSLLNKAEVISILESVYDCII